MPSLHWQQSFWSVPPSCRMMLSHVRAVAAATGGEGFHGGAAHFRGGAVHGGRYGVAGRGYGVAGRGYGYRPIPGRPVARTAVRGGVYGAAVGAAAVGAYGYYNNRCYQDGYGNTVCPQQYPY